MRWSAIGLMLLASSAHAQTAAEMLNAEWAAMELSRVHVAKAINELIRERDEAEQRARRLEEEKKWVLDNWVAK